MKINHLYFLLILILTFGCKSDPIQTGNEQNGIPTPTISELTLDQQSYHLKNIELTGYFNYTFENVAVYSTERSGTDEAVWVDFSDSLDNSLTEETLENLQGRKLRVQGTFDATRGGHLGVYIGTMELTFLETLD